MEKLKKETTDTTTKRVRNIFRLENEIKVIKDMILRCIRNLVENEEEENYHKVVIVSIFSSNNYT